MRGAPLANSLKKILLEKSKGKLDGVPKDQEYVDNLAAKKTAYQSDALFRQFELTKKTCQEINSSFVNAKVHRGRTKGKF